MLLDIISVCIATDIGHASSSYCNIFALNHGRGVHRSFLCVGLELEVEHQSRNFYIIIWVNRDKATRLTSRCVNLNIVVDREEERS